MATASEGSFNILVISEINGSKKYMYDDGFVGLAHYVKNLQEQDRPSMLVINGGLLPEIPAKGGTRNLDKLRVLVDGVKNLDGAAAVIKPHMERLFAAIGPDAEIVYAMGTADQRNIETLRYTLASLFSVAKQNLKRKNADDPFQPRVQETEKGIASREATVQSLLSKEKAINARMSASTKDDERKKLAAELLKNSTNIKINSEELEEFRERKVLLEALRELALASVSPEDIKARLDESTLKQKEANEKLVNALKGTEEYEAYQEEAKALGNRVRALSKRLKESVEKGAANDMMANMGNWHRFSGNIPLPRNANDVIDALARSYYISNIRDALGRKREINIQEQSLAIYHRQAGGFEFNVMITDSLNIASGEAMKGSNRTLPTKFYILMQNAGLWNEVGNSEVNVLISSRNMYTSFSMDPLRDQSTSVLAMLAQSSFIDTQQSTMMYLNKINTTETKQVQKTVLDSSASIVTVNQDGSVVHRTIKSRKLDDEKIKSDREEARKIDYLIEKMQKTAAKPSDAEDAELDVAVVARKRPSEISDRDMPYLNEETIRELSARAKAEKPLEERELGIALITDVHAGNYGDLKLLEAAVKDALPKKPDILVLGGDNIEGDYKSYSRTARPENHIEVIEDYEKYLRKQGVEESEVSRLLVERMKKQGLNVIPNLDQQPSKFVETIESLVADVIQRGGYILIVSGNHPNKTDGGTSKYDEARQLEATIKQNLRGRRDLQEGWEEHIKIGTGSDWGAETFNINGKTNVEVRHELSNNEDRMATFLESKRSDSQLVLTGHGHSTREVVNSDGTVVEGACMQERSENPYTKRIHVPSEREDRLTGYLYMRVKLREDGKVTEHTFEPRLRQQLGVDEPKFNEFLRDKKTIKMKV